MLVDTPGRGGGRAPQPPWIGRQGCDGLIGERRKGRSNREACQCHVALAGFFVIARVRGQPGAALDADRRLPVRLAAATGDRFVHGSLGTRPAADIQRASAQIRVSFIRDRLPALRNRAFFASDVVLLLAVRRRRVRRALRRARAGRRRGATLRVFVLSRGAAQAPAALCGSGCTAGCGGTRASRTSRCSSPARRPARSSTSSSAPFGLTGVGLLPGRLSYAVILLDALPERAGDRACRGSPIRVVARRERRLPRRGLPPDDRRRRGSGGGHDRARAGSRTRSSGWCRSRSSTTIRASTVCGCTTCPVLGDLRAPWSRSPRRSVRRTS